MSLPIINNPVFTTPLSYSKTVAKFEGMNVADERNLLIGKESGKTADVLAAIQQCLERCVKNLDVNALPMFEAEYLLLNIRARSVNPIVELTVKDKDDEETYRIAINLDEIAPKVPDDGPSDTIKLDDTWSLKLRYPQFGRLVDVMSIEDEKRRDDSITSLCLESVFQHDGDVVSSFDDETPEDVNAFFGRLGRGTLEAIEEWIDATPKLKHTATYKKKDGTEGSYVFEGLGDFFI